MGNNNFSPSIQKLLEKKGYFRLSPTERKEKNDEFLRNMKGVEHIDYDEGKRALKVLRGDS